ncbi:MAG: tRNA 2-selenouridine(34) synthase MnmH [Bacteroidia bacterium]|nr:tRNA 2-selenouridine(34) synthase MnmH [Bacteroidia bacterium]
MPKTLQIADFLELRKSHPIIDVRSPQEFLHGHIPGAINIPLFDDAERAIVGTLYKQKGQEKAFSAGLEIVTPKLHQFAQRAHEIAKNGVVNVHCWRGGMRSGSMASFFETQGLKANLLEGGYKSYRRFVLEQFARPLKIAIVGGETGSGKTEILQHIQKAGEQILDLEKIASHRGSSFGALGMNKQPTVEQFENNLLDELNHLDSEKRIWMEDESRSIGRVFIPAPLWEQMSLAPVYRVRIPFDVRVQRLIHDYGSFPVEVLKEAVERIKKRLGGLDYKIAMEALENGDAATVTAITLRYYDKAYDHPHKIRNYNGVKFIDCDSGDPSENAIKILNFAATE